jgi:lactoylglutathione lyase
MKAIVLFALAVVLISPLQKAMAQTDKKPAVAVLNHIAIYVADLKQATDFYHDLFNLEIAAEPFHDGKRTCILYRVPKPGERMIKMSTYALAYHRLKIL